MQQFCAPVNLIDNHWIVMYVIMPCSKYSNGKVFLTNHAAKDSIPVSEQYRDSNVKYSLMWWAKWFGIYHKETAKKGINEAHLDYTDMRIDGFSLEESAGVPKPHIVSSLDHATNSCHGIGLQTDGYNCGIWVILELFNRMEGFTSAVDIKTEMELKKFRLSLFNLLIHIYELHEIKNDWLFELNEYGGIKNKVVWQDVFNKCKKDGEKCGNFKDQYTSFAMEDRK